MTHQLKKQLPIGISNFKKVIEGDYYYVDKSLMIKEVIDNRAEALLLPRPRRFGKTLNLSMLNYFFNRSTTDTSDLFKDLAIWKQGKRYTGEQGAYLTVLLTFKDIKYDNWDDCYEKLILTISDQFERCGIDPENSNLSKKKKLEIGSILDGSASKLLYHDSLKLLTERLFEIHQRPVVMLIDEYDTPIQAGYFHNYYNEVINFFRPFLSAALKDNEYLHQGILTGILRVSKESIFSALNNLKVSTSFY